jgi:hypothetical protein
MTANIHYHIRKILPLSDPAGDWKWVLIRGANVEVDGKAAGVLPDADAAIFASEEEANLFAFYLSGIERRAEGPYD